MASRRASASAVSVAFSAYPSARRLAGVRRRQPRDGVGGGLRLARLAAAVERPLQRPLLRGREARPGHARGPPPRRCRRSSACRPGPSAASRPARRRRAARSAGGGSPAGSSRPRGCRRRRGRTPSARAPSRRRASSRVASWRAVARASRQPGGRAVAQDGEAGAAAEGDRDVGDALRPPRRDERRRAEGERPRACAWRGAGRRATPRARSGPSPASRSANACADSRIARLPLPCRYAVASTVSGRPVCCRRLRQHGAQRAAGRARRWRRRGRGSARRRAAAPGGRPARRRRRPARRQLARSAEEGEREQGWPEAVARNDVAPSSTGGAAERYGARADGDNPRPAGPGDTAGQPRHGTPVSAD